MPRRSCLAKITAIAVTLAAISFSTRAGEENAGGRILKVRGGAPSAVSGSSGFPTLSKAVEAARPGDVIEIAPGEYRDAVVVPTPGLVVRAAQKGEPGKPSVTIFPSGDAPAVVDRHDTEWRDMAFGAPPEESGVLLEGFKGVFENCVFTGGSAGSVAVEVNGGAPVFQGCTFLGKDGAAASVRYGDDELETDVDFRYCLFRDFSEGVLTIRDAANVRFANCLLTGNGVLVTRGDVHDGKVEFVNSVLYFNNAGDIAMGAAGKRPVRIVNSVYTPTLNANMWIIGSPPDEQKGVEVVNSRCLSPRFANSGRPHIIGLGIDDARNIPVWAELSRLADEYGFKTTMAVNTELAGEEDWDLLRDGVKRGHEVGSHSSSHTPLAADPPMSVGVGGSDVESARLEIDATRYLSVFVDDEMVIEESLDRDDLTIAALAVRLRHAGLKVKTAANYRGVPARFLKPVGELDIAFPNPVVPLSLTTDAFFAHELKASRRAIAGEIPGAREIVFINPFSVSSPMAKEMIAGAGYVAARSNISYESSGIVPGQPDRARINVLGLPGYSLLEAKKLAAKEDGLEGVRMALDYASRFCPVLILYSHGVDEFSMREWRELLAMLGQSPLATVATLKETMRLIKERGNPLDKAVFEIPLSEPGEVFRPAAKSPLIGAGVDLGLEKDYEGNPVPEGAAPNIGLYQGVAK